MNEQTSAVVQLHIAVLLFGFTAILGDLIMLSALEIVWWRLLLTCGSIVLIRPIWKMIKELPRKHLWIFAGIGIITTAHWLTFYGSIKCSNPSTTLICLATTSLFTAFLEPIILKKVFSRLEILLGLVMVPAMYFIVQSTPADYNLGIALGLLSALLAALFSILNKKHIDQAAPLLITFIELGAGCVVLTIILIGGHLSRQVDIAIPSFMDLFYLVILALLCTTLAYVLALKALKHLSAFAANLSINLEPVYGIILAYFLLNDAEELSPRFYLGAAIILSAVFIYFIIRRRQKKTQIT